LALPGPRICNLDIYSDQENNHKAFLRLTLLEEGPERFPALLRTSSESRLVVALKHYQLSFAELFWKQNPKSFDFARDMFTVTMISTMSLIFQVSRKKLIGPELGFLSH
jgi:hypothetical protein